MKTKKLFWSALLLATIALIGCKDDDVAVEKPGPIAMTEEAVGYYCNMNILEHAGPKAQIHLSFIEFPIWFSQVRDAIAYTRLPEETQEVAAIYVHDMSKAASWEAPGDDAWIDIQQAFFVIGSKMAGGMGAPETIPFGSQQDAREFASKNGGKVVKLADIPDAYVLGPVELNLQTVGSVE